MRHQAAADKPVGAERTDEDGGPIDDGYGQALAKWRVNEAVERAEGRAKTFLRQLWWARLVAPPCQRSISSIGSRSV